MLGDRARERTSSRRRRARSARGRRAAGARSPILRNASAFRSGWTGWRPRPRRR